MDRILKLHPGAVMHKSLDFPMMDLCDMAERDKIGKLERSKN